MEDSKVGVDIGTSGLCCRGDLIIRTEIEEPDNQNTGTPVKNVSEFITKKKNPLGLSAGFLVYYLG